jgi:hypothetical protein
VTKTSLRPKKQAPAQVHDSSIKIQPEKADISLNLPSKDEFNELIKTVELKDISLLDTRARYNPEILLPKKQSLETVIRPIATRHSRVDGTSLYCGVRFDLILSHGQDSPAVVEIYAEYAVLYEIPEALKLSLQTARMFARRNAVFNTWPFFRELVYSCINRMGLPTVILASFRLDVSPP